MAGKGGGAWKVAYADFVTAMMAFFLVMWIVAQSKPIKEAVAGYFRDPFGTASNSGSGSGKGSQSDDGEDAKVATPTQILQAQLEEARARLRGLTETPPDEDEDKQAAHKAFMVKLHDGNRTSIGATIQFDEESAEIDKAGKARLSELAPQLRGKPNKIEIRGHSTMRPLPSDSPYRDAWELCYARSQAVFHHLTENGVEPERIRLSQAGVYEPRTQAAEHESRARNARVEVFLLGEHAEDLKGTRKEREGRVGGLEPAHQ